MDAPISDCRLLEDFSVFVSGRPSEHPAGQNALLSGLPAVADKCKRLKTLSLGGYHGPEFQSGPQPLGVEDLAKLPSLESVGAVLGTEAKLDSQSLGAGNSS